MGPGGKRQGAGRKPKAVEELKKAISISLLDWIDETKEWKRLYDSAITRKDDDLCFQILKYHSDQKYGKPVQRVWVGGDDNADPVKVLLIGEMKRGRK